MRKLKQTAPWLMPFLCSPQVCKLPLLPELAADLPALHAVTKAGLSAQFYGTVI